MCGKRISVSRIERSQCNKELCNTIDPRHKLNGGCRTRLYAARTALIRPRVNEPGCNSTRRWSVGVRFASSDKLGLTPDGNLPRRFASLTTVVISRFSSVSVRCLTAFARFFGKTCRCDTLWAATLGQRPAVEKHPGPVLSRTGQVLLAECGQDLADHRDFSKGAD
jgi:hypothetical protein